MSADQLLHVVLVRSLYASNIGSTSRAMVNMGFKRLILINPQCEVNSKAQQAAAAAQGPLQNRTEYESFEAFFEKEGDGLRIGMTRRGGKLRTVTDLSEQIGSYLTPENEEFTFDRPVYLVFGPENDGLSNQELLMMNHFCSLPTYGEMGSLNLAQAVLLALFMVRQTLKTKPEHQRPEQYLATSRPPPALPRPFPYPEQALREWLETLGFDLSAQRVSAYTTLTRLLLQNKPSGEDLRVLETILRQNIRKLNGLK